MCAALDISIRTYYKYRDSEDKDYYDYLIIKEIFDESKGTYGYRRICEGLLIKYSVIYNDKPNYARRKKSQSYKRIEANVKPNLVSRNFNTEKKNQIWTTDITYLIFKGKRAYLSTIIELYDKKIVEYKI